MFIVDGHLDLGMNAMEWKRDLRQEIIEINEREKGLKREKEWFRVQPLLSLFPFFFS